MYVYIYVKHIRAIDNNSINMLQLNRLIYSYMYFFK